MTEDGIADYQGLRRFLLRLDPPPPDHIRVFRGQTRDFGRMLPSGLRGTPLRSEVIFRAYTALLASDVPSPEGDEGWVDAETYVVWTRAIAQHYGPGSHYLDVTTSVDVALWFALHEVRTVVSRHCFGPPGPMDARTDTSRPVLFYAQPMNVHQFARNDQPMGDDPDWHVRPGFNDRIAHEVHQVDGCLGSFFAYLKARG